MRSIEATVRELLATKQEASKAKLDAGLVDTVFKVAIVCYSGPRP